MPGMHFQKLLDSQEWVSQLGRRARRTFAPFLRAALYPGTARGPDKHAFRLSKVAIASECLFCGLPSSI